MKEKHVTWEDDANHYMSRLPELDPANETDAALLKDPQPDMTGVQLASEFAVGSEESLAEFRQSLEEIPEMVRTDLHYRSPYVNDIEGEYNPVIMNWRERGATGMENDPRMKQIFVDLEFWIEDVIGAKQIHDGEV
jgi:hypothetical protein